MRRRSSSFRSTQHDSVEEEEEEEEGDEEEASGESKRFRSKHHDRGRRSSVLRVGRILIMSFPESGTFLLNIKKCIGYITILEYSCT